MYAIHTELPQSKAHGARSMGIEVLDEEKALKFYESIKRQLIELNMTGYFVVLTQDGEELQREEIL